MSKLLLHLKIEHERIICVCLDSSPSWIHVWLNTSKAVLFLRVLVKFSCLYTRIQKVTSDVQLAKQLL